MTRDQGKLASGKEWIVLNALSFDAIPTMLPLPYETFVLMVAADALVALSIGSNEWHAEIRDSLHADTWEEC